MRVCRTMPPTAALLLLLGVAGCTGDTADVLECEGTCSCDQDARTCSCEGGTDCEVAGASDVTLTCDGNARCALSCEELCRVECPGTAGCEAVMGPDSEAVCNGTGSCDYTCEGDCTVDCPGASSCVVRCAEGASCAITSCGPMVTDCGDGVQACRTACPAS